MNARSSGWTLSIHPQPMTSPSGAPRYSSTRLLTYSIFPSGPALHTSAGIASTSKRSSCSLLVSASSGLSPSVDIDRSIADPQIYTFVVGGAELQRIADSQPPSYPVSPRRPTTSICPRLTPKTPLLAFMRELKPAPAREHGQASAMALSGTSVAPRNYRAPGSSARR